MPQKLLGNSPFTRGTVLHLVTCFLFALQGILICYIVPQNHDFVKRCVMGNELFLKRLNDCIERNNPFDAREVLLIAKTIAECNNMNSIPLEVLSIALDEKYYD